MIIRIGLLITLFGLWPVTAMAQSACPPMAFVSALNGTQSFQQTRLLSGFSQPIVSSGSVTVSKDGVIWTVTHPVEITTRLTDKGMFQSVMGGPETPLQSNTSGNPMLTETGLLSLLRGDMKDAETYYTQLSLDEGESGWTAKLKPKNEALSSHLASITLQGCSALNEIKINQTNGDQLTVVFGSD